MKSKQLVGIRNNVGRVCGEDSRVNQLRGDLMLGDVIWVKINGFTWWPGQVVDENNVSDGLKPPNRVVGEVLVRLYGSYEYLYVDSMKCRAEFENILKQNNGSYSETFGKALEQDLSCIKSARNSKTGGSKPRGEPRLEASKVVKLKQHGTRRTQEADGPSVIRASPRRQQNIKKSQKRVKSGELVSRKAGEEDQVQKKLKASSLNSARGSLRRQQDNSRPQKTVKSGELVSRKAGERASENETPKQDLVQKKLRPNSPNSVLGTSGKSQDLSERRTRVMQSLGLIAPCGSPFHRNGLALPSNLSETR